MKKPVQPKAAVKGTVTKCGKDFLPLLSLLLTLLLFGYACSRGVPDSAVPEEESGIRNVLTSVFDFDHQDYRDDTVYP